MRREEGLGHEYPPATREGEFKITEADWTALMDKTKTQPQPGNSGSGRRSSTAVGSSESGGNDRDKGNRPTDEMEFRGDIDAKRFHRIWTYGERSDRSSGQGYGTEIALMRPEYSDLVTQEGRKSALVELVKKIEVSPSAKSFLERVYFSAIWNRFAAVEMVPLNVMFIDLTKDEYGPFARHPKLEEIERRLFVKYQEVVEFKENHRLFQIGNLENERGRVQEWMNQITDKYTPKTRYFTV